MAPGLRYRVLISSLLGILLPAHAACSSGPAIRAEPEPGQLVEVFDAGKDGYVNGIAVRADRSLLVTTDGEVRAIPPQGEAKLVMTGAAYGPVISANDGFYVLEIRDGIVYEDGPQGRRAVTTLNAPQSAGPLDPGLKRPSSLAWEPKSQTILVADDNKIDRIDPRTGMVATVTGARGGDTPARANGLPAGDARYTNIDDITVDPADGTLLLSDTGEFYRIDPAGLVTHVRAQSPGAGHRGLVFDARTGDLFFGQNDLQGHGRVQRLSRGGEISIIVSYLEDSLRALALDPEDGSLYLATERAVFVCATPETGKCNVKK